MSKMIDRALEELKIAGYDISDEGCNPKNPKDPFDGYANSCARNAMELLVVFSKAGHSGMSAGLTLAIFNKLANWKNLSPLTNNPDEWMKLGNLDNDWQSKRNPSCFSKDLKTYYDINEKEPRKNYDLEDYKCISK